MSDSSLKEELETTIETPPLERMRVDSVDHPAHYTAGPVECIEAIEAAVSSLEGFEAYCTGNAIKYLWRWKRKNGVEDLRKARWYIDRLLGHLCREG